MRSKIDSVDSERLFFAAFILTFVLLYCANTVWIDYPKLQPLIAVFATAGIAALIYRRLWLKR